MPPASTRSPASGGGRRVVLVVEDEILIAMDLELLLEQQGWQVLGPATSVAQALRLLEAGPLPEVALLDVNLRGELVTPVAQALRARGVPFLLASAYDRAELDVPALAGAVNLGKPTDQRRLLAALKRAVDS